MDDPPKPKGPTRGMQLGKGRKGANDFLEAMRAEGENMSVSCWAHSISVSCGIMQSCPSCKAVWSCLVL